MKSKVILSVCAIMKDEAPYLLEWLEFHKVVGVQRFYLYDNGSSDNTIEILQTSINAGEVILHEWPVSPGQLPAYEHCLQTYQQDSEWIAFIDLDEFLFPTEAESLRDILSEFDSVSGIGVNWLIFGTSGHQTRPDGLQIENFTRRAETDFAANRCVKSIVRPEQVSHFGDPHFFSCQENESVVTEDHLLLSSAMADHVSVAKLRINHYFTRSREEMHKKILRGRSDTGTSRSLEFLEDHDRNEVEDTTIQRFIPQLKQAIERHVIAMHKSFVSVPEIEMICDSNLLWTGYLDYPQVNCPIYGSTLFVSGWIIGKQDSVVAVQFIVQDTVISEIPVNIRRPDVLEIYQFVTDSNLLGFRGTLSLHQLPCQGTVHLQARLANGSTASCGYFKIDKTTGMVPDSHPENEVLSYERA